MDENTQLQIAMALSREEAERTSRAREKENDHELAMRLQEQELAPCNTHNPVDDLPAFAPPQRRLLQSPSRRNRLTRVFDAVANVFAGGRSRCSGPGDRPNHGLGVPWNGGFNHPGCCGREEEVETCHVCHQSLRFDGHTLAYCQHPFWREKFCHFHNTDGTPHCSSCERLKPQGIRWVILSDGREICVDCSKTMVVDTNYCYPLYEDVLQLYRALQLELPQTPPLLLVDRQALNEQTAGQEHGGTSQTRGMTLAEEYRSIRTVYKRRGSFFSGVESYPVEHRTCRVSAILILFGLPKLLTGSILAHECMHAYLKSHNKTDLTPVVEEGLCQLMAYLWIEKQQPEDPFDKRLASFIANQIRLHPSPDYGDGFRMALSSLQCYGLPALINHVKLTGLFPEPR